MLYLVAAKQAVVTLSIEFLRTPLASPFLSRKRLIHGGEATGVKVFVHELRIIRSLRRYKIKNG